MRRAGVLAGVLLLLACTGRASAQSVTLKWAWQVPSTHHTSVAAEKAARAIEEGSKREIKVLTYPAGQLYKDKDLLDAVQNGSIDLTFFPISYWSGQVPTVGIMQMPFAISSYRHVWAALDGEFGQRLTAEFEKRGVKTLGWWDYGFVQAIANASHPIRRPEDLKGLKIRSFSPIATVALEAMGASAPVISGNEVYLALQSGVIDGLFTAIQTVHHRKLYEVSKYLTLVPLAYETNPVMINETTWARLTPAQRAVVEKAVRDYVPTSREAARREDEASLAAVRATKLEVYEVPATELAAWRAATRGPATEAYLKRAGTLGEAVVGALERAE